MSGCQEWGWGRLTAKGHRGIFWGVGSVLHHDGGGGSLTVYIC